MCMAVKTFRTDPESEEALAYLADLLGTASFSAIVRYALMQTAQSKRRAALRAECEALRDNPAYLAEIQELNEILDPISAW